MAISIDPLTFIISIPRADLTLIQTTPTEVRELNLNSFRLSLKDWEDGDGITFLKTHTHNTEVSLGGLTFARVIEILDPYSITFEDGQYAVNLVGANSNVGDKVNLNQVSVRSSNSAGLISSPDIEFSSFNGGVTIDTVNGFEGTVYPTGTERKKSNNIGDGKLIAEYRGFEKFYAYSSLTLVSGIELANYTIQGKSNVDTLITIYSGAEIQGMEFNMCRIVGVLDGNSSLTECVVGNLTYVNGVLSNCALEGTIILGGYEDAYLNNCTQFDMNVTPSINMGGSGQDLVMPNYSGLILITNLSGPNKVGIGLNGGAIILDNSVTSGTIQVSGIGNLTDTDGNYISSGTWNGGVTVINGLISKESISESVWDTLVASHSVEGTFANLLIEISNLTGNRVARTDDIITIYEDDGTTPWRQYNLVNGGRIEI